MSRISTTIEGSRIYFAGNTFPIKDQIKSMGGHWDGDRKQWWVGAAKKDDAAKLVTQIGDVKSDYTPAPITENSRVYRKVKYTGKSGKTRTYYVVAESRSGKFRLTTLDRALDFWADSSACETMKVYQPRQVWDGRRYSGKTVEVYTTIGSIADFIADSRKADEAIQRGEMPDGYTVDLEDGAVKRISECDMPASEM